MSPPTTSSDTRAGRAGPTRYGAGMSAIEGVSEIFDPAAWEVVPGFEGLTDLTYHRAREHGTVRIAFVLSPLPPLPLSPPLLFLPLFLLFPPFLSRFFSFFFLLFSVFFFFLF